MNACWMPAIALAVMFAVACGSGGPLLTTTQTPHLVIGTQTPRPTSGNGAGTELTQEQRDQISQIVHQDPRMAEIAGDVPYAVQDFGIWTAGTAPDTGEELFIGGTARVVFSSPIPSADRDWPDAGARPYYSSWPPEERAKYLPYKQGTETFAVNNLRHAWVKVDLTRERLVEIAVSHEPQDGQTVTYEQAGPTPVYTQGVPTIATDIFNSDEQIAALLSGRTYNTGAIYTFTVGDVHLASVYAAFEQPQDIEGDWMLLFDFNLETGEYETHTMHFKATEVQAVGAVINLDKGRVAWVEPNAHFND